METEPRHRVKYGWDESNNKLQLKSISGCLLLNSKEDLGSTFSLVSQANGTRSYRTGQLD